MISIKLISIIDNAFAAERTEPRATTRRSVSASRLQAHVSCAKSIYRPTANISTEDGLDRNYAFSLLTAGT